MKFARIILIFLLFMVIANSVEAIGIGISPPRVFAENLLRGSHFEKTVELSRTDVGEELKVTVQVEGQTKEWVSTNVGNEFIFPKDAQTIPITVTIDVPEDAANGEYEGVIRIRVESVTKPETGKIGAAIAAGVLISTKVSVTGEQVLDYSVSSVKIPTAEEDAPIYIILTVDNKGNVRAQPTKVHVDFFDKFQNRILLTKEITDLQSIEPFSKGEIIARVSHNLTRGQYWAVIKVYKADTVIKEDKVIFDVLEAGSLVRDGILKEIVTKANIEKGEIAKISGLFENSGTSIISAKLKAEIYFSDIQLIKVVESEEVSVGVGKTERLDAFFTPTKSGRYIVRAFVLFAGKRTDIQETTFMVEKRIPINARKGIPINALLAGILILIAVMVIIRKYLRKGQHKIVIEKNKK